MGIENELTVDDIRKADAVIFAAGIPVQKRERFVGKRIFEVPVQDAIKNAEAILQKIQNELGR